MLPSEPAVRLAAMHRTPLAPVTSMPLPALLRELASLSYARTPPYVPHPQEEGGPTPPDLGLQAMTKAMSLAVREGSTHAVAQRSPHRAPRLEHAVFADANTAVHSGNCMGPLSRTFPQSGGTITHLSDGGVPVATPLPGFGTACQPALVDTAALQRCAGVDGGSLVPCTPAGGKGTVEGSSLAGVLFCDSEGETDPRVALPAFLVAHDDDGASDDPRERGEPPAPPAPLPSGADASALLADSGAPPVQCVPSRVHPADPHAAMTPWASVDRVDAIIRRVTKLTTESCGRAFPLNPPPPPFVLLSPDSAVDVGQWPVPHRSTEDHRRTLRGMESGLAAMSAARKAEELHMRQVTGAIAVKVRLPSMTYQYVQDGTRRVLSYGEYEARYMADVEAVRGDEGQCVITCAPCPPPSIDSWWAQPQGPVKFAPAVAIADESAASTEPPSPAAAALRITSPAVSPPEEAADGVLVDVAVDALVAALQEAGGSLAPLSHPVPAEALAQGVTQLVREYLASVKAARSDALTCTPHPALPPSPASASSQSPADEMTPLAPPSPLPTPPSVKRVLRSGTPPITPSRATASPATAATTGSPAGRLSTRRASVGRTPVRVGSALRQCSAAKALRRAGRAAVDTPMSSAAGALFRAVRAAGAPVPSAPLGPLSATVDARLALRFGGVSVSPARVGDVTPARQLAASPAADSCDAALAADVSLRNAVSSIEVLADEDDDAGEVSVANAAQAGLVLPFQLMPSPFQDAFAADVIGGHSSLAAQSTSTPATPQPLGWAAVGSGEATPSAGAVLPQLGPRLSDDEAQELRAAAGSAGLLFASPGALRPGARAPQDSAGSQAQHSPVLEGVHIAATTTPSAPITAAQILCGPTPEGLRYTPLAQGIAALHISATPESSSGGELPVTVPRARGSSSSSIGAPALQRLPPCSPVEDDVLVASAPSLASSSTACDSGVDGVSLLALVSTPVASPRESAQGRSHGSSQDQRTPPALLITDAQLMREGVSFLSRVAPEGQPLHLCRGGVSATAPRDNAAAAGGVSPARGMLFSTRVNLFTQAAAVATGHGTPPSIRSLLQMASVDPSADGAPAHTGSPHPRGAGASSPTAEEDGEADPSPVHAAAQWRLQQDAEEQEEEEGGQ